MISFSKSAFVLFHQIPFSVHSLLMCASVFFLNISIDTTPITHLTRGHLSSRSDTSFYAIVTFTGST